MEAMNIMKLAWKAYTANLARLVIGTAIMFVIFTLLGIFSFLPALSLFFTTGSFSSIFFLSLMMLVLMISIGLMGAFMHGYLQFVAKSYGPSLEDATKGKIHSDEKLDILSLIKPISLGKEMALMFYAFAVSLFLIFGIPYFYTGSITSLIFSLPFALVFLFFTAFAPCFVAFKKSKYLDAFGKSFEFVVKHFWEWLGLAVVLGISATVLMFIPVVGPVLLFTLCPWFELTKIGFFNKA